MKSTAALGARFDAESAVMPLIYAVLTSADLPGSSACGTARPQDSRAGHLPGGQSGRAGWARLVHRHPRTRVQRQVAYALVQAARRRRAVPLRGGGAADRFGHIFGEVRRAFEAPAAAGVTLGLLDCAKNATGQAFDYDAAAMEFRPGADPTLCLAAGAASRSAGPFMSRDLALAPCASTGAKFKQWRIRKARP